jgi:hypothetical protein
MRWALFLYIFGFSFLQRTVDLACVRGTGTVSSALAHWYGVLRGRFFLFGSGGGMGQIAGSNALPQSRLGYAIWGRKGPCVRVRTHITSQGSGFTRIFITFSTTGKSTPLLCSDCSTTPNKHHDKPPPPKRGVCQDSRENSDLVTLH